MRVPTTSDCIRLMDQYEMLPNIRQHSLVVARIADLLVTGLQRRVNGQSLPDRQLCISGGLLHDIAKTHCLDGSCDHARAGAEICLQHGFPEIARIVEEHVILKNHDPSRYQRGAFTAREIVYYADKRVRHDEIVTLEERLDYIIEHYGHNDAHRHKLIRSNFNQCRQLEDFLFNYLDFSPGQLLSTLNDQEEISLKSKE